MTRRRRRRPRRQRRYLALAYPSHNQRCGYAAAHKAPQVRLCLLDTSGLQQLRITTQREVIDERCSQQVR